MPVAAYPDGTVAGAQHAGSGDTLADPVKRFWTPAPAPTPRVGAGVVPVSGWRPTTNISNGTTRSPAFVLPAGVKASAATMATMYYDANAGLATMSLSVWDSAGAWLAGFPEGGDAATERGQAHTFYMADQHGPRFQRIPGPTLFTEAFTVPPDGIMHLELRVGGTQHLDLNGDINGLINYWSDNEQQHEFVKLTEAQYAALDDPAQADRTKLYVIVPA